MKKIIISVFLFFIIIIGHGQKDTYLNPVSDTLFAEDPFVLVYDGLYYCMQHQRGMVLSTGHLPILQTGNRRVMHSRKKKTHGGRAHFGHLRLFTLMIGFI
jgi:hypothetical protein